jgi:hypothetical protein
MRTAIRPLFVALFLATALAAAVPAVASRTGIDRGTFVVYSWDRPVGRETFSIDNVNDTIVVASEVAYSLDMGKGPEDVKKSMRYAARAADWRFIAYNSVQTVRGTEYAVGGVPGSDTTVSVYHEVNRNGTADILWRPRGRLFVLDAMLYANVQALLSSLGPDGDSTDVAVLALGNRDTVVTATLRPSGSEKLSWGGKPVTARTLRYEQSGFGFDVWVDPAGRVLRLAHVPSGLRVDREPPAVKRAAAKPKPRGAG